MSDELGFDDARIRLDGWLRDCFMCGKTCYPDPVRNDPHFVSSPKAGNIQLAAHGSCLNGREEWEIAARYQRAVFAAVTGGKERT